MSVSLKILPKPDLEKVKMSCDGVIHKKLLKYPMIEEAFSTNSFNVVCGRMGQGKTSLVTSLVKSQFKKCFHSRHDQNGHRTNVLQIVQIKNLFDETLVRTK